MIHPHRHEGVPAPFVPAPHRNSLLDSSQQKHRADEGNHDAGEKRDQIHGVKFHSGPLEIN